MVSLQSSGEGDRWSFPGWKQEQGLVSVLPPARVLLCDLLDSSVGKLSPYALGLHSKNKGLSLAISVSPPLKLVSLMLRSASAPLLLGRQLAQGELQILEVWV